jgi:DNA-binding Lrp family transcriptional regulator
MTTVLLDDLDRALLDGFQRDFPLAPRPYAAIAARLGVEEEDVLARLARLRSLGLVDRVGAVVSPGRTGASTLAALAVPEGRLEEVAAIVGGFDEVNHNYEREHAYNLWFVLTAPDEARIERVLAAIEARTGLAALRLPLLAAYHIDLGFPLAWT